MGMIAEGPVVKLRKRADAPLDAGADGCGPQNAVLAELQAAIASLSKKSLDLFVRGARKEKYVVKVALPGKFSFPLRQAGVLHEFARRERAQGHHGHAGILGERLQGFSGRRKKLRDGNAGKAAKAQGRGFLGPRGLGRGPQVEIVFRQVNPAAVFSNEGVRMTVFTAGVVELESRAAGQPDGRNALVIERRGEFIEAMDAASPEGNQCINRNVENAGRLAQARLRSCEAHSIGILKGAVFLERKKAGRSLCPPHAVPGNLSQDASLCI